MWDVNDDDDADDDDDVMMMMMMTLMKLVNFATKFRHGMDKFYQTNSGLRGSKSGDEAIYTSTSLGYRILHLPMLIVFRGPTGKLFIPPLVLPGSGWIKSVSFMSKLCYTSTQFLISDLCKVPFSWFLTPTTRVYGRYIEQAAGGDIKQQTSNWGGQHVVGYDVPGISENHST